VTVAVLLVGKLATQNVSTPPTVTSGQLTWSDVGVVAVGFPFAALIDYGLVLLIAPHLLALGYRSEDGTTFFQFSTSGFVADMPNLGRHFDVGWQDRLSRMLMVPESTFRSDADYARFVSLVSSHGRWFSRLRRFKR
jgi:hypothetical protein